MRCAVPTEDLAGACLVTPGSVSSGRLAPPVYSHRLHSALPADVSTVPSKHYCPLMSVPTTDCVTLTCRGRAVAKGVGHHSFAIVWVYTDLGPTRDSICTP